VRYNFVIIINHTRVLSTIFLNGFNFGYYSLEEYTYI